MRNRGRLFTLLLVCMMTLCLGTVAHAKTTTVTKTTTLGNGTVQTVITDTNRSVKKKTYKKVLKKAPKRTYTKTSTKTKTVTKKNSSGNGLLTRVTKTTTKTVDKNYYKKKQKRYTLKRTVTTTVVTKTTVKELKDKGAYDMQTPTTTVSAVPDTSKTMQQLWGSVDDRVKNLLAQKGVKLVYVPTATYSGMSEISTGTIYLKSASERTFAHEAGHFLQWYSKGRTTDPAWINAFMCEKDRYPIFDKEYAKSDSNEMFACVFSTLMMSASADVAKLEAACPLMCRIVKERMGQIL